MNASKLLAVAFASSIVASAAMAQTDTMTPAATAPNDTSAQVQPGEAHMAAPVTTTLTLHPTQRVQGMVPADMVYQTAQPDNAALTRDQVKAELVAARADGELSTDADNHGPALIDEEFTATRTRAEVNNEIALARVDNVLNTASDNQPVEKTFYLPNKSRADVRAETVAAMAQGPLSRGDKAEYVVE